MGPTMVLPATHHVNLVDARGRDVHPLALVRSGATAVVPMAVPAGSVVLMDTRLVHCGGSNWADEGAGDEAARVLLYLSVCGPASAARPIGSTYNLMPHLRGMTLGELCGDPSRDPRPGADAQATAARSTPPQRRPAAYVGHVTTEQSDSQAI